VPRPCNFVIIDHYSCTFKTFMKKSDALFKISFINQGKVFEVFAKEVYQADLYGFIVIEALEFDSKTDLVVDPSEEKLKTEFEGVIRTYVPMHAIIRIDEVNKRGTAKVSELGENVSMFPGAVYTPASKKD